MASGNLSGQAPIIASIIVGIAVAIFFKRRKKKEDHGAASPAIDGSTSALPASSSSSLLIPHGYEFEVFLSFRGPDTRGTFTDFLYEDLIEKGIGAFRDEEGLRRGEEINSNLVEAINKSKMYIPIFSKGYAASKWCLRELAQMVDCMRKTNQKTILPIFYDVTPHDVRNQTGDDYYKAFFRHETDYPGEVQQWREALQVVGNLKGWDLTISANRCQGRIVKVIVLDVQNRLKKPLDVVDQLTGIDDHAVEIMDLLEVNIRDVRVVGLWGLGGVGKTTIAKFIYNELMDQFDYCSFLPNVAEKAQQPDGLASWEKQLLSDISRHKSMRKVLILIDDVDHVNQLVKLVPNVNSLVPGSRIIVTTRYRKVLEGYKVGRIHEVTELSEDDALELFCKHAFREGFLVNDYFDLSLEIVKATGGLPLSIEVIGSHLSTESDKDIWQEALQKLRKDKQILSRLRISYDALDEDGQEIFLDIACLYSGKDIRILSLMWKECGFTVKSSIKELLERCLVKIGDDYELSMHDQLKYLGREIVRSKNVFELGQRSRLWLKEDVVTVLDNAEGTKNVKAIRLDNRLESQQYFICNDMFEGLSNVQYLELVGANFRENFQGRLLRLLWLSWNGCTDLTMPSSVCMQNLIILDLSKSDVSEGWSGWNSLQVATKLQVLNLAGCRRLTRTPDFSSFRRMKRLILQGCSGLVEVGPLIKHLTELVFLDLRNCGSLEKLPNELGSLGELVDLLIDGTAVKELSSLKGMPNLVTLSARSCTSLRDIPPSVGSLAALRHLWLDNCRSVFEIPLEIGDLESLEELSLPCTKVANLPDSIQSLSNLKVLNISQCPIQKLPQSLWELEKLEEINASKCQNLTGDIPPELGGLHCLRILRLDRTRVTNIPESIIRLSNLQTLDLEECQELHILPKLPSSLKKLLSSMTAPNLSELVNLRQLVVVPCTSPKYDVYLSFSQMDVTSDFINKLYDYLTCSGFCVFKNNPMELGPQVLVTLMQASTSIVVMSESYASSTMCLMELSEMVKCMERKHQLLTPIFYGTDPDEVGSQTGPFAKVFSDLSKENDPILIRAWRAALNAISQLKGSVLPCNSSNRDEIVKQIGGIAKPKKNYLRPAIIGIEEQKDTIRTMLDLEANDVRMLGILGMGGTGKTTLAKAIYDELKDQFAHSSFLRDIGRTIRESKGLESLQRQLLLDISGQNRREEFAYLDEGKSTIMNTFRNKKVLVILDDVHGIEQLYNLAGRHDWFGPGSRIIITTRDLHILRMHEVEMIYEVSLLPKETALQLFYYHAFGQEYPELAFDDLANQIASYLQGIPIAIETIGSTLFTCRDQEFWKDLLMKLKMRVELTDVLKICYDALSDDHKEIFLDIACLFVGVNKSIPVYVWEARQLISPTSKVIQDLLKRSLIKIGDDNKLWMHDLLRGLGGEIVYQRDVRELGNRRRLWRSEDAMKLLQSKKGTGKVEAISLELEPESENYWFGAIRFRELSNLWFLALGNAGLEGDFQGLLPKLIWLSWHGRNLLKVPSGLHLKNLVVLDLSRSAVTDDWSGWGSIKDSVQLKVLDLTHCHELNTTPDFASFLGLKRLILEDCRGLITLHPSIGLLKELEFLDMRNCRSLKKLPDEFKSLVSLIELLIDETPIRELPISSKMTDLENLSAKSCKYLTRLPRSLGSLPKLIKVTINQSKT